MISLISSLSLKLFSNSSVYDRNIFGSSLKVFGNLRNISGSYDLRTSFVKFSKIFGKWSETLRKSSKTPYVKREKGIWVVSLFQNDHIYWLFD